MGQRSAFFLIQRVMLFGELSSSCRFELHLNGDTVNGLWFMLIVWYG
jgi:hypothetical protein